MFIEFSLFLTEYKVHSYNRNGLCALGFMDDHYPVRSAFSLLNQVSSYFLIVSVLLKQNCVYLENAYRCILAGFPDFHSFCCNFIVHFQDGLTELVDIFSKDIQPWYFFFILKN